MFSKVPNPALMFLVGFIWLSVYVALEPLPTSTLDEVIEHAIFPFGCMVAILTVFHYGVREHHHMEAWSISTVVGAGFVAALQVSLGSSVRVLDAFIVLGILMTFIMFTFIPSWKSTRGSRSPLERSMDRSFGR